MTDGLAEVPEPNVVLENAAKQTGDELHAKLFRLAADSDELHLNITCDSGCGHPDNAHGFPWCSFCSAPLDEHNQPDPTPTNRVADEPCMCLNGVTWRMALRELNA